MHPFQLAPKTWMFSLGSLVAASLLTACSGAASVDIPSGNEDPASPQNQPPNGGSSSDAGPSHDADALQETDSGADGATRPDDAGFASDAASDATAMDGGSDAAATDGAVFPPSSGPLDVRYPIAAGEHAEQCLSATEQFVWGTLGTGTDTLSRWAVYLDTQTPGVAGVSPKCGSPTSGHYPIVFNQLTLGGLPPATYVVRCAAPGVGEFYQVLSTLTDQGLVSASFRSSGAHPACL